MKRRDERVGGAVDRARAAVPSWRSRPSTITPIAVGERGGVAEVVGDEQRRERELGEQVLQLGAHDRARVRVERRRAARRAAARPGRARARARARRAGARRRRARRAARRRGGRCGSARAARRRAAAPPNATLARTRHVREQRVLLEDEADRALLGRQVDAGRASRTSVDRRARSGPSSGATQAGDRAQHGRLAGARRADERERLAPDGQAERRARKTRRATAMSSSSGAMRTAACRTAGPSALSTTSRMPIASATSKFASSCS